ncbi:SDR family oxidoreductase [Curtobacterium aetherium]|uniref:SDR family oxidoreductase n=1 Tax=Curtobacterium aetherium TaxID=2841594 RepID=A0ACD1E7T4_9MICO|nr:SDR family oxidoreductase [Curtobacterium sp. L6-1]QWS34971.1 SDR family oxidoreductase [Curtobacterium sp. L6-1]
MSAGTRIDGATLLVTGANGGLGVEFVAQALERGAARVYAAARTPRTWADERIVPLELDVDDQESVERAARTAGDTTITINNAGTTSLEPLSTGDVDVLRAVVETNLWGSLRVARAFAPVMQANGGGSLVNVLSAASWVHRLGSYSVSKAAMWAATDVLRLELAPVGIRVVGLHLGFTRTPMMTKQTVALPPMGEPDDVVRSAYDQIEAGALEVLADERSRQVRAALALPLETVYPEIAQLGPTGAA